MNEKVKLQILLENFHIICRYYPKDNLDGCQRLKEYHFCNCDGDIKNCNLSEKEMEMSNKL
jgi:hypothetical protein